MIECPYCGVHAEETARFCDRCGERLTFEDDTRDGFLRRTSIQYLQGVRHGARPLDPATRYHDELVADLGAAIEDFSQLARIDGMDLAAVLDIDDEDLLALDPSVTPETDLNDADRRSLGLAVVIGLLEDSYEGTTLDEVRALTAREE